MSDYHFSGHAICNLDSKNRLSIPSVFRKKIRPEAENTLVFAPGMLEVNMMVFPLDAWNVLMDSFKQFSILDMEAQQFIREFVGSSFPVTMDAQGRTALPAPLLQSTGIESELKMVGMIGYLEIWKVDNLENHRKKIGKSLAELSQQADLDKAIRGEKTA